MQTTKGPELIPEDADPIWAKASQGILSSSDGVKHIIWRIATNIYDRMRDPWMGPMLLFVACLYSLFIWLQRSQPTQPNKKVSNDPENLFHIYFWKPMKAMFFFRNLSLLGQLGPVIIWDFWSDVGTGQFPMAEEEFWLDIFCFYFISVECNFF